MHKLPPILVLAALVAIALAPAASAAVSNVGLGTAEGFAILAGSGITNTGPTTVSGDVGSHPTPAQTGFGPGADSVALTGTNHHDNAVTQGAKADLLTAYNDAAGRPGATPVVSGELGGLVLPSGVYGDDNAPDSLAITGTLTLDGQDDPDSVFIFQSGSTLITASGSNVALIRGAQACRIFWQIGSSATLGTASHLEGTIMAATSITLGNAATLNGRALASNGAVTMDTNTIQLVPCATGGTGNGTDDGGGTDDGSGTDGGSGGDDDSGSDDGSGTDGGSGGDGDSGSGDGSGTDGGSGSGDGSDGGSGDGAGEGGGDDSGSGAEIPYFPTNSALILAGIGGIGAALVVLTRRL